MTERSDSSRVALSAVLVVFGATGDLAHRKLYPALSELAERNQLPQQFAVVGVARTEMSDDDFAALAPELAKRGVAFHYVAGSFDDARHVPAPGRSSMPATQRHGTAGQPPLLPRDRADRVRHDRQRAR